MRDEANALFESVAFHLTDRCNISCAHCMPESGPACHATMKQTELAAWLEELVAIGLTRKICLTGGEPFIVPELLSVATQLAKRAGMECAVMTNASWGASVGAAKRLLRRYEGITKIGISTDRFHRAFVPIQKVRNVIAACRQLGKTVLVRAAYLGNVEQEIEETTELLAESACQLTDFEAQPVLHLGRARRTFARHELFEMPAQGLTDVCRVADTPVVTPNGKVFACCGPSMTMHPDSQLQLGDLRKHSMREIMDAAEQNTALQFIRSIGPRGLLEAVTGQGATVVLEQRPQHICELCIACFSTASARLAVSQLSRQTQITDRVATARLVRLGEITATHAHMDPIA